jgi:hypothetical protein
VKFEEALSTCDIPLQTLLIYHRLEFLLAGAAIRAYPVVRQIFERGAGPNAIGRVSHGGVVYVTAQEALVLHDSFL